MVISAYSKINVGLSIKDKRDDGFHEIDSYFVKTSLSDTLEIEIEDSDKLSIDIKSNLDYLEGKKDLMERAASLYSSESGILFSIKISIIKNIPSKAGLGGGSSDAASILSALNNRYSAFSDRELEALALDIGSDVPFFLKPFSIAHVRGRGEIIEKAGGLDSYMGLIIFMPRKGTSTIGAYRILDSMNREYKELPELSESINKEDYPNDFELIDNDLVATLSREFPRQFVSLSGSGSAVYVLIKKRTDYEKIYKKACDFALKANLDIYPAIII